MKFYKKALCILMLVICFPAYAERIIPDGFSWADTGPQESDFLKPDDWFLKIEEVKGIYAVFITKEKIENGKEFQTGFSLNVIKNIKKKTNVAPSLYAQAFVEQATKDKVITKSPWAVNAGPFKGFGVQVKDSVKTMHYMLIANDKTNTLFIAFFESPPNEWNEAWKIGQVIFNNMKLDDQI